MMVGCTVVLKPSEAWGADTDALETWPRAFWSSRPLRRGHPDFGAVPSPTFSEVQASWSAQSLSLAVSPHEQSLQGPLSEWWNLEDLRARARAIGVPYYEAFILAECIHEANR